jgi:hypothetical protein
MVRARACSGRCAAQLQLQPVIFPGPGHVEGGGGLHSTMQYGAVAVGSESPDCAASRVGGRQDRSLQSLHVWGQGCCTVAMRVVVWLLLSAVLSLGATVSNRRAKLFA